MMTRRRSIILCFFIPLLLACLTLFWGIGCYFVKTIEYDPMISRVLINEQNGDIVISYANSKKSPRYNHIIVYDATGTLKNSYIFRNAGKPIYRIAYSNSGELYCYLSMKEYHVRLNPDGTYEKYVDASDVEYLTDGDYWKNWEKSGSSYLQTQRNNTYVYDYPSFFDYYTTPVWEIYVVNESGQKNVIWSSNFN